MLALYKSLYGGQNPQLQAMGQIQQGLAGGAPGGTNRTTGVVNGTSQLMAALIRAQRQKQLQQQIQNQQSSMPAPAQGMSLSSPSDPSPSGMGVPGGP